MSTALDAGYGSESDVFDPDSGLYYNPVSGHYFDAASGWYYDGYTGEYTVQAAPRPQFAPPATTPSTPAVVPCDPRFFSTTVAAFPSTSALRVQARVPLAGVFQPLAPVEEPPRSINFGAAGVIRCRGCRCYINPYVVFKDNYSSWDCNVCGRKNELPMTYRSEIMDPHCYTQHPELTEASYDIIAPPEYTVRPPQPPTFVFVLDVSTEAVRTGALASICAALLDSLDSLPGGSRTRIGIVTFDSRVHYYSLSPGLIKPSVFVMPDLQDVHVPLPADLLVTLEDSRAQVEALLTCLPDLYGESMDPERALGPALDAAYNISHTIGGKLLVFISGLPTLNPGSLSAREDPRACGTDTEHALLSEASEYYRMKAEGFTQVHLMIDLFVFPSTYTDLATLGTLALSTGGQVLHYPGYSSDISSQRLAGDLYTVLTREQAWEAVVRVRATKGVKVHEYYGSFFKRSSDLLAVPTCDAHKTFAVELLNDETPLAGQNVLLQCALLYSNSEGERRLRIHNVQIPVVASHVDLYSQVDVSSLSAFIAKKAVKVCTTKGFQAAREFIQFSCSDLVNAYKKAAGQYVALTSEAEYPLSLQRLPLVTLALLKSSAFKDTSDIPIDARSAIHANLRVMSISEIDLYLVPRLYRVDHMTGHVGLYTASDGVMVLPEELMLSASELYPDMSVLLCTGRELFLRIGNDTRPEFLTVFSGSQISLSNLNASYPHDPNGSTQANRLWNVIQYLGTQSTVQQEVFVFREGDPQDHRFAEMMLYDRSASVMAYHEFIQYLAGN